MEKESVKKFDLEAAFKALDEIEIPETNGIKANRVDLKERFSHKSAHEALVEDYYDVSSNEDLEEAKEEREGEVAQAKLARIEKIVDLDAETADDLLPSYVGKVIMQCPQCMTLFYKNPEDIEHSEENPDVVNINEVCQHCGNTSGYTLIGKVDAVADEEADKYEEIPVEETKEAEEENELDLDFGEPTEEVDAKGTGEAELSDDELAELDLDLAEVENEKDEEEKKEESLNLSKAAPSEFETEHKSENLTLNEDVDPIKVDLEDFDTAITTPGVWGIEQVGEDVELFATEAEAREAFDNFDFDRLSPDCEGIELFVVNNEGKPETVDTKLALGQDDPFAITAEDIEYLNTEAPGLDNETDTRLLHELTLGEALIAAKHWHDVNGGDVFWARVAKALEDKIKEVGEKASIDRFSLIDNKLAINTLKESLNNSEVQKDAEEGSELKTENESENLTLNEEVDKDLDAKLKAHNDYIAYLQQMIKQEKEALKKTDNEEVKAAIQRRLDAFTQDLHDALPDVLKDEPEANEVATEEPVEEMPTEAQAEEEPKTDEQVEEEAPVEEQLTEDAAEEEKPAEDDNEIDYVDYKHSYCHVLEPKLKAINYLVNVKKVEPKILKGYILKLLKDADVKWTEKEKEFKKNIEEKDDAYDILNYVKNSIEKAKTIKVKVDENGELIEGLNEGFEGCLYEKLNESADFEIGGHRVADVVDMLRKAGCTDITCKEKVSGGDGEGDYDDMFFSAEIKDIYKLDKRIPKTVSLELRASDWNDLDAGLVFDNNDVELDKFNNLKELVKTIIRTAQDEGLIESLTESLNKSEAAVSKNDTENHSENLTLNEEIDPEIDAIIASWGDSVEEGYKGTPEERTTHLEYVDENPADGKAVLPDNIEKQLTEEDEEPEEEKSEEDKNDDNGSEGEGGEPAPEVEFTAEEVKEVATEVAKEVAEVELPKDEEEKEDAIAEVVEDKVADAVEDKVEAPIEETPIEEPTEVQAEEIIEEPIEECNKQPVEGKKLEEASAEDALDTLLDSEEFKEPISDKEVEGYLGEEKELEEGIFDKINSTKLAKGFKEFYVECKDKTGTEVADKSKKFDNFDTANTYAKTWASNSANGMATIYGLKEDSSKEYLRGWAFDSAKKKAVVETDKVKDAKADIKQATKDAKADAKLDKVSDKALIDKPEFSAIDGAKKPGTKFEVFVGSVKVNEFDSYEDAENLALSLSSAAKNVYIKGNQKDKDDMVIMTAFTEGQPQKPNNGRLVKFINGEELKESLEESLDIYDPIEELNEETFNAKVNNFLQEVYSNVKSFEATSCELTEGKLIVEGCIKFNSGKEKLTIFEFLPNYGDGKLFLEGLNKDFSNDRAFMIECSINDSKQLVTEQFCYHFKINEALVEGLK